MSPSIDQLLAEPPPRLGLAVSPDQVTVELLDLPTTLFSDEPRYHLRWPMRGKRRLSLLTFLGAMTVLAPSVVKLGMWLFDSELGIAVVFFLSTVVWMFMPMVLLIAYRAFTDHEESFQIDGCTGWLGSLFDLALRLTDWLLAPRRLSLDAHGLRIGKYQLGFQELTSVRRDHGALVLTTDSTTRQVLLSNHRGREIDWLVDLISALSTERGSADAAEVQAVLERLQGAGRQPDPKPTQ